MPETCFSRLRSDDIVTPRRRTWSLAVMGPVPRSSDGPLLPRRPGPYLDPAHKSSVLSVWRLALISRISPQVRVRYRVRVSVWANAGG